MRILLDADIICYEIGCATDDDGHPLQWPLVRARVDARIESILRVCEASSWQGFLTGSGNFREKVATIRPYKGHRDRGDRPFWYQAVFDYLKERGCIVIHGMEADDALAMEQDTTFNDSRKASSIIVSRDKDLLQVPGWHYQWPSYKQEEQKPFWVSVKGGWKVFFKQCLTGDAADNIPGLYGIGPKSSSVLRINEYTDELDMFNLVQFEYERRFGSYWRMFLEENGTLLWLLRHENDSWKHRLECLLERKYNEPRPNNDDSFSPTRLSGVDQRIIVLD